MPKVITYNTCGPIESNSEWTQDFVETMYAQAASRGSVMTYDEKQVEWAKWNRSGGSTTINANSKFWIIQVGSPIEMLSPSKTVDAAVFNGDTFVVPETIGYDVNNLMVSTQNSEPTSTGYSHDPNTGTFNFVNPVVNAYIYFETVTYNSGGGGLGALYYGTKSDDTPLTLSDIQAGTLINYTEGIDVTVPFTGSNQRYWVAYPSTDTTMQGYYVNALDYGTLGDPGSTFYEAYTVSGFNVAETYPTSLSDTTFKH